MTSLTRRTTLFCLAALGLSRTAPTLAETRDDLYRRAKENGRLKFYSGGPIAPYQKLVAEFEQAFPGVTVSFEGGFSNVLNEKIEQQIEKGQLEVDLAFFQTAQDFVAWKKRGLLLNFHVNGHENILPAFKD